MHPRSLIAWAAGGLTVACIRTMPRPEASCWPDAATVAGLRTEVAFDIAEREGQEAVHVRNFAGIGRDTTLLDARLTVIDDDATCAKAGASFENAGGGGQVSVVRVGRAYWARSTWVPGILVLDEHFAVVMRVVDLW